MPKAKLEVIVAKRKEAQKQINAIDQQAEAMKQQMMLEQTNAQEILGIGQQGYQMIDQALAQEAAG